MSRNSIILKKKFKKELKYQNFLINLLIQEIIKKGKYLLARNIVYKTFLFIEEQTKKNPIKIFELAIKKSKILFYFTKKLTKKEKKKSIKKIPLELNDFLGILLGIKNILKAIKKRNIPFSLQLANEIIKTANNKSEAVKKQHENIIEAKMNKTTIDEDDLF